ncbi:shikimate dehydrogenase [Selenomonas flueggei]|uniref:shikimate dehydrogenase n=1 Tax=Selenomonas flueggei TaxID=135080 RepID=UPI00267309F7|nr:shikimate dehydrogenase [Selenomonas flueggei]
MHVITGKTKILGVIGAPIAHSLSPIIQNVALHEAGLDYVYTAFPVHRVALASAVCGLRDAGVVGFNVTIPFKTEIMPLLDALSEDAQRIRAVNTVVIASDGTMTGHNTDVTGFMAGFAARGIGLAGKRTVLIGAGGAARAALWGLLRSGVSSVCIGVRNLAKGKALCTDFAADGTLAVYCFDDPHFRDVLCTADIVVQTTPIGMSPQTDAMPPVDPAAISPSAAVYDLIYTPAETAFLRAAAAHGCTTINGETMLVMQGAEAFSLWTGVRPNTDLMQRVLREELARREGA